MDKKNEESAIQQVEVAMLLNLELDCPSPTEDNSEGTEPSGSSSSNCQPSSSSSSVNVAVPLPPQKPNQPEAQLPSPSRESTSSPSLPSTAPVSPVPEGAPEPVPNAEVAEPVPEPVPDPEQERLRILAERTFARLSPANQTTLSIPPSNALAYQQVFNYLDDYILPTLRNARRINSDCYDAAQHQFYQLQTIVSSRLFLPYPSGLGFNASTLSFTMPRPITVTRLSMSPHPCKQFTEGLPLSQYFSTFGFRLNYLNWEKDSLFCPNETLFLQKILFQYCPNLAAINLTLTGVSLPIRLRSGMTLLETDPQTNSSLQTFSLVHYNYQHFGETPNPPSCKHPLCLERFSQNLGTEDGGLIGLILKRCPNLDSVKLRVWSAAENWQGSQLPTTLSTSSILVSNHVSHYPMPILKLSAPLKRISINISFCNFRESEITKILNNFHKTLEYIKIDIGNSFLSVDLSLGFPHVREIIINNGSKHPITGIGRCPSLTILRLKKISFQENLSRVRAYLRTLVSQPNVRLEELELLPNPQFMTITFKDLHECLGNLFRERRDYFLKRLSISIGIPRFSDSIQAYMGLNLESLTVTVIHCGMLTPFLQDGFCLRNFSSHLRYLKLKPMSPKHNLYVKPVALAIFLSLYNSYVETIELERVSIFDNEAEHIVSLLAERVCFTKFDNCRIVQFNKDLWNVHNYFNEGYPENYEFKRIDGISSVLTFANKEDHIKKWFHAFSF